TAIVIDPVRFSEATVHGHIRSIVKSGRVQGRTTMNLSFDSIDLTGDPPKHGVMHGYVTRIYANNARTDEEGGVQSEGRGKQTLKRSGIGATAGAIIGGIAGGGKGAAIGLILGGAGGAGSVAINGGKELKIESGTEMLVHVTRQLRAAPRDTPVTKRLRAGRMPAHRTQDACAPFGRLGPPFSLPKQRKKTRLTSV